jgi:hypothetical protein
MAKLKSDKRVRTEYPGSVAVAGSCLVALVMEVERRSCPRKICKVDHLQAVKNHPAPDLNDR